ncbi:small ribosomal subunit Rsm22 family protein [Mesorhizobium sp. ANAO-SY3R2]|uniref:small ribosomal subunit Rsm22 family protein n=1 Tax=Mesorhizobium sp. ANAO-SY3R2 TaxID=3166644 RepID=UPI00366FD454
MELPAALRAAVDRALEGVPLADLQRAADTLSARYRAETRDGRLHLSDEMFARAYLATRLPATFAAVRASMESAAELMPGFEPKSLLDVGAGPGTALWAAADCWPTLGSATLLEASQSIRKVGEELSAHSGVERVEWRAADASKSFEAQKADLVTLAYVLDELSAAEGLALAERLWAAVSGLLVIVEPGTPAGWRRMMAVRSRLVELGAHLVAPCPHSQACPIAEPDWCHFSRRVARSRLHRLTKRGEVPWEDEKYIFIAAARQPAERFAARVLAPARGGSGKIQLKLCQADGSVEEKLVTKRDGELFKTARRADWGDIL